MDTRTELRKLTQQIQMVEGRMHELVRQHNELTEEIDKLGRLLSELNAKADLINREMCKVDHE